MRCSDAREFFSAKVDGEISWRDRANLDHHLGSCSACRTAWTGFQRTVGFLQTLPETTTEASFVGQVFDRVRDYEARGVAALEPNVGADVAPLRIWAAAREWIGRSVLRPMPALALGALVIGVLVGSWVNRLSTGSSSGPEVATVATSPDSKGTLRDGVKLDPVISERPFADLADEVEARDLRPTTSRVGLDSPNWGGPGLQQQVRFENDGPRIIF